jgi:pimeloyl-ACP methyl ester carboxylesterase
VLIGDLASLVNNLDLANESYEQALAKSEDPTERQWIANKRHESHYAVRAGANIAYYVHGSGDETILLVSPLGYGLAVWQPILERLCQEFRIITIDLRGTGRSSPIVRPYTDRDHALDIATVIRAISDRPIIGVGLSAAPYALVRASVADPRLFKKLVLVGGDPGADLCPSFSDGPAIKEAVVRGDLERAAHIFLPYIIFEPGTEELIEQRVQAYLHVPQETLLNFFTTPDPTAAEFGPLLARLQLPTLVMHGTADRATPVELARQLAARIPGGRFYPFVGRCHMCNMTATEEFCDVLRQFVLTGQVSTPASAPVSMQPAE